MSDPKNPAEPSIDEILATIRRIISDDEQGSAAAPAAGEAVAAALETKVGETKVGGTKTGEPKVAETKTADDDVLELTEALNEDGTTRHLAPIGGASAPRAAAVAETPPPPRVEPQLRLRPSSPPEAELPRRDTPNLRLAPAQPSAAQPPAEPQLARDMPLGGRERTLDDIVRDTLRPLLLAWLDENLPPVVERLVQAEITRVAREAASGRS